MLVGGIMMVGEKPLALTEAARDASSPVQESHVCKLLANQTSLSIGTIDLTHVASGKEALRRVVEREQRAGRRIIIFDAVSRRDLATIAEVALSMETVPLLAGSAGLAGEVARILVPGQITTGPERQRTFRHVLIIGGSASAVTHAQLQRLQDGGLPSFELPRDLVSGNGKAGTEDRRKLARLLGSALAGGSVIFRTFTERWTGNGDGGAPIPQRITGVMAGVALEALREARVDAGDLALILTGGDTALGVLQLLDYEGIELEGELLEGIVRGNLRGGPWDGLTVVTKAGAFGKEDALVRIVERLGDGKQGWTGGPRQGRIQRRQATKTDDETGKDRSGEDPPKTNEGIMKKPLIGISVGDPAGIGPEITAKALAMPEIYEMCRPLVVAESRMMREAVRFSGLDLEVRACGRPRGGALPVRRHGCAGSQEHRAGRHPAQDRRRRNGPRLL